MVLEEWLLWSVTETLKFFMISYGIFGFEQRKGAARFWVFLYLVVGIPLVFIGDLDELYFISLWGILFVLAFFQGSVWKKIKAVFLQYIAIMTVDTVISGIIWLFYSEVSKRLINMICDTLSVVFWLTIFFFVRKYREVVYEVFFSLPLHFYFVILCTLLGAGFNSVNTLADIMGEKTIEMGKVSYVISNMVLIIMIVCGIMVIRVVCSWKQLQMEKETGQKIFNAQKRHYEVMQQKADELRHFRHDVKKHIAVLQVICKEGKVDRVEQYVSDLHEKIRDNYLVYTGNRILDYFVNELIFDLRGEEQFTFDITGRFEEELPISDSDICVLFGNAVDNCREALKQCDGEKKFQITVRNYHNHLFVRMCNTAKKKQGALLETSKRDGRDHGYGTRNMRRVVEKYDGNIEWKYEDGMFVTEVVI